MDQRTGCWNNGIAPFNCDIDILNNSLSEAKRPGISAGFFYFIRQTRILMSGWVCRSRWIKYIFFIFRQPFDNPSASSGWHSSTSSQYLLIQRGDNQYQQTIFLMSGWACQSRRFKYIILVFDNPSTGSGWHSSTILRQAQDDTQILVGFPIKNFTSHQNQQLLFLLLDGFGRLI